jgi:sec-independent protein translocase protein TatA
MFSQLGAPEILIILGIVVLLFGAKKLPELARGAGQGLRIFKSEMKGELKNDTSDEGVTDGEVLESIEAPEPKPEQA